MTTLRKKITAIALAGTVAAGSLAIAPASAAPVAPNQDGVKQSVQANKEDARWRRGRWVGPAIALGVIGAIAAHQYRRDRYYYDDYGYRGYYGPTYYYGPGYGYYGPRRGYYYGW